MYVQHFAAKIKSMVAEGGSTSRQWCLARQAKKQAIPHPCVASCVGLHRDDAVYETVGRKGLGWLALEDQPELQWEGSVDKKVSRKGLGWMALEDQPEASLAAQNHVMIIELR